MLLKTPWKRGPEVGPQAAVVVVTHTTFSRLRDMPGAALAALRFRHRVPKTSGAIGLSLGVQGLRRRSWSISAWRSTDDLERFVTSPAHRAIVARYRAHVTVRSHTYVADRFDLDEAWKTALQRFS
jgi:heme-degrading monooxygenase HmoA